MAKKKGFAKTLEEQRKGCVSTRGEHNGQERKGLSEISSSSGSSQSDSDRLIIMEALLASLLNNQLGTISLHGNDDKSNQKLIHSPINHSKNSVVNA
jgi:hypothetical protein